MGVKTNIYPRLGRLDIMTHFIFAVNEPKVYIAGGHEVNVISAKDLSVSLAKSAPQPILGVVAVDPIRRVLFWNSEYKVYRSNLSVPIVTETLLDTVECKFPWACS